MLASPLVEVVFEVRFNPKNNFSTELLIQVNQVFENQLNITQADGLKFPADLKSKQQDLYYVPSYRVDYPSFSLLISDGSLIVLKDAVNTNYSGWCNFKSIPTKILGILKAKNKISEIHRFSLKYTNLIASDDSFRNLDFSLKIGDDELDESTKLTLKTEVKDGDIVTLTDIESHVELQNSNHTEGVEPQIISGTLFIIDVINNTGIKSLENVDTEFLEVLEILHLKASQTYTKIYNKQGASDE